MITGFFLRIGFIVLNFVVGLLPVIAFPTAITSAVVAVAGYINAWSYIFPVGTLFTVLTLAMIFHIAVIVWKYAHLVGRYIRGR